MTARPLALGFLSLLGTLACSPIEAAEPPTVGPAAGTLVVIGGGGRSSALIRRFVALAGGDHSSIVVIPTADENDPADFEHCPGVGMLRQAGAGEVRMLHTRDRAEADSESFVEPLRHATGVWLGGGRQWRLADAYLNTRTQRELFALLARGGAIGGSSAGATIQGSFLVRGSPEGNHIMVAPDHLEGFAFLRHCAIDQHVNTRHREADLVPVIENHPDLLGIGLDEDTAIIVRGDVAEVAGAGIARFHSASAAASADGPAWTELRAGQSYDLKKRALLPSNAPAHP